MSLAQIGRSFQRDGERPKLRCFLVAQAEFAVFDTSDTLPSRDPSRGGNDMNTSNVARARSTHTGLGCAFLLALLGCGGADASELFADAAAPDSALDASLDGSIDACVAHPEQCTSTDAQVEAEAATCVGLKCQQVVCGGSTTTTVSGTVWDPAGKNPLYQVVVYVPNAALDPIMHGPVCDSCGGAAISGKPIVTAMTDAQGKFVLKDVPVGKNIPLVMQIGKWRRQITLPNVAPCQDTPITDKAQTHLPTKKSEGDMPLIALVGGCDPLHTLMQKIGIDITEFTNNAGSGTVHVYSGQGGQNAGVSGATDAYAFWGDKNAMFKYDMLVQECECAPYPRDSVGPAYTNMKLFLDAGGRVLATHYQLNFFGSSSENGGKADVDLQNAATWTLWGGSTTSPPTQIDTSFPKGKAMDDWLENLKSASAWSGIKVTPKGTITANGVGDIGAAKAGISQRWLYSGSATSVIYLSFNTPTTAVASKRCGRAIGSDLHAGNGMLTSMSETEAALEFVFFDLAACVIDDAVTPVAPPPIP
jgi:hypothetical protein